MKWLLIALASAFGLGVVCCLLGIFVGIPAARGEVKDAIQNGVATEVAQQIPAIPGVGAEPGEYVITESELQDSLRENSDQSDDQGPVVHITPDEVRIGVQTRGGEATYSGVPTVENGQFVMQDMRTDSRVLRYVLAPDDLGEAVSGAVNTYLSENGLRLESIDLQEGQLVLVTVAAE
jgi:hypothetical protein